MHQADRHRRTGVPTSRCEDFIRYWRTCTPRSPAACRAFAATSCPRWSAALRGDLEADAFVEQWWRRRGGVRAASATPESADAWAGRRELRADRRHLLAYEGARPDRPRYDDPGLLRGGNGTGAGELKAIGTAYRREDFTTEAFFAYWRDVHAPISARAPGLRGYVVSEVVRRLRGTLEADAFVEQWWPDEAMLDAADASPEVAARVGGRRQLRADHGHVLAGPGARLMAPPTTGPRLCWRSLTCRASRRTSSPRRTRHPADGRARRHRDDPLMLVRRRPELHDARPHHRCAPRAAAHDGATGYAPGAGIQPLREAIAEKVRRAQRHRRRRRSTSCVTTGGCGGLFTSLLRAARARATRCSSPTRAGRTTRRWRTSCMRRAVGYPLDARAGCRAGPRRASRRASRRARRAILVNSPRQPDRAPSRPPTRLRAVLEVAERHDLWVISDECYDELVFEGRHVSHGDPRRARPGHLGLHVLEVVRDDRLARRLRRSRRRTSPASSRSTRSRSSPARRPSPSTLRWRRCAGRRTACGAMTAAYRERRDAADRGARRRRRAVRPSAWRVLPDGRHLRDRARLVGVLPAAARRGERGGRSRRGVRPDGRGLRADLARRGAGERRDRGTDGWPASSLGSRTCA